MSENNTLVPNSWNEYVKKHEWNQLSSLLYFNLDERQNRDVLYWIDENARKYGHVPLWYMLLRNRLKYTQHILSCKEFEILLQDMIIVTVRIVEDIVTFKKIYGVLSSNAYTLLRNKLVTWIKKFEPKTWNPIAETETSWKSWIGINNPPVIQSDYCKQYNSWPSFQKLLESSIPLITPLDDLNNTHCGWTNYVYAIPLNTIVFGNVPESLLSTMETNADAARNQRELVRKHLFENIFSKMNTWDEFWNVSLNDLII
jgi:hypothetical protein